MIKAIFTDFFGVLHNDTLDVWLENHGLDRTENILRLSQSCDTGRIDNSEFFEGLAAEINSSAKAVMAEFEAFERLDESMISRVRDLHAEYKTALISNSGKEYLQRILDIHNLGPLFDHVLISGEIGISKPDERIFQKALSLCGVAPQESIFIDDRKSNLEGAKQIGIHTIHFKSYDQFNRELAKLGSNPSSS